MERKIDVISILKTILRILLGAFFITTAIMKLLSLDNFELYIFSFRIFNFVWSTVVARLVIMAEMIIGFFLIFKILYRPTWWSAMLMLVGFTLLLVYIVLFRNDSNCHCMGDIVELDPLWSIVKNVVTMLLLLLVYKETPWQFKGKKAVAIVGVCAAVLTTFAFFPLDDVYVFFSKRQNTYNEQSFQSFMNDSLMMAQQLDDGRYIMGVLSSGCHYCLLSGQKLSTMHEIHQLDTNRIILAIWGNNESIQRFKDTTNTAMFRYVTVSPFQAVELVNGAFPTYLFIENMQVVKVADLRQLTERDVVNFLQH